MQHLPYYLDVLQRHKYRVSNPIIQMAILVLLPFMCVVRFINPTKATLIGSILLGCCCFVALFGYIYEASSNERTRFEGIEYAEFYLYLRDAYRDVD
jgi:hypothetical protein